MLSRLIEFSIENRMLVIALTLLVAIGGVYSAVHLPIDAVPDMTNAQVRCLTDGRLALAARSRKIRLLSGRDDDGRAAPARAVAQHLEVRAVGRHDRVSRTAPTSTGRGTSSRSGWSRPPTKIPPGYGDPELGPMATALGEILQFEVRGRGCSPMDLRSILDWEIAPQVAGSPRRDRDQRARRVLQVVRSPPRSRPAATVTASRWRNCFAALEENNVTAGGGYVEHYGEQRFIRGSRPPEGRRGHRGDRFAARGRRHAAPHQGRRRGRRSPR